MRTNIGAFDARAWSGLVFCRHPGEGFGIRFGFQRGSERADMDDFYYLVHEVGPHDPAGRYARMSFDLSLPFGAGNDTPIADASRRRGGLTLEWGRVAERSVVGRVRLEARGQLVLTPYFPWDWAGRWQISPGELRGASSTGRCHLAVVFSEACRPLPDESAVGFASGGELDLFFAATIAGDIEDAGREARALLAKDIAGRLSRNAEAYEERRLRVEGAWQGLADSVVNSLHWMVLLKPESNRLYTPAGRHWIFPRARSRGGGRDHWTVFGWDSYFNVLELAVENLPRARDTLMAGLETAYDNGCIPNWRSRHGGTPDRSQPPVASFAALKLHLRAPDDAMLEAAYPALVRWSEWWDGLEEGRRRRTGNHQGLYAWGSDVRRVDRGAPPWEREASHRQLAAWESGQDDLPTWSEASFDVMSRTLTVDPVDLNAYRVLDLECLSRIANHLGRSDEAETHRRAADDLRVRMNDVLWDDESGTYRDRLESGAWARTDAASHFLPLVAGVPSPEMARRMVERLLDEGLFWGPYVVPTVSRDDPHFPVQQYWKGTIWPPVNYLVYQGLRRYGFDAEAGETALRSVDMFLESWRRFQLCRENYDSRTGEGGGKRHQSWGPLLALMGLEEFGDVTPWEGLRFGSLRPPGPVTARRLRLRGVSYTLHQGPGGLRLEANGRRVVWTDAPVVLRELEVAGGFRADVACEAPIELEMAALEGHRWNARIDGRREELTRPRVRLGPGHHRVDVREAPDDG